MTSQRVLIVEDDEDIRGALAGMLEELGYSVTTAEHGQEALEQLREPDAVPAIILLDIMMPVMDGLEFLREQMRDAALCNVPVVVMTALSNAVGEALTLGAAAALVKPIDVERLVSVMARVASTAD